MSQTAARVITRTSMASQLTQEQLNIEAKERSNLYAWRGQFSPQLVEAILEAFGSPGAHVVDPFVGSGTVLAESGRLELSALGAEINPAAAILARTYSFINTPKKARQHLLRELDTRIIRLTEETLPLLGKTNRQPRLEDELLAMARNASNHHRIILDALLVRLDLGKRPITGSEALGTWTALRDTVLSLPESKKAIRATLCDARRLPLKNGSADIVLTSPPYINVFNYHQQYRQSVEHLGWDVLNAAQSEIGSNRKHRGNRFLTVIQYCLDMTQVLIEMRRILRPNGHAILVVGRESNVRKTPFFNGQLIEALASDTKLFDVTDIRERVFTNRFGQSIYEDLLFLAPTDDISAPPTEESRLESARRTATEALIAARTRAPEESASDLTDAIEAAGRVEPSRLFVRKQGPSEPSWDTE